MKSTAQGRLLKNGTLAMAEAMGYVLSLPGVSTLLSAARRRPRSMRTLGFHASLPVLVMNG
ncbi:MAG: hypothetical protein ACLP9L_33925 [Thermoguttaceae bacterium]